MTVVPGTRLGPYEIVSLLGVGGMGEVYRARDTRLERTVAIKILSQLSYDPARKQRFEREARAISRLNDPNICTLHDIGHQDGIDYLVMECVEGETLAKRLERGPLPLDQVLKIGAQIADALDKAHRSGIVHRDLKPGNIMLTPNGAKLLDFGLAKPASALADVAAMTATKGETPVTERGTIVGTFQYMSPEQIEGREFDGRSDIFSLGAVLYEMVTGQRAFEGKSRLSIASAILEKEPAPISTLKPLAPAALDHTIRNCLAKNPDDRWQTARDLSHELKWTSESSSQANAAAVPGRTSHIRRERIAWATAAALLCGLAALGAAYYLKKSASAAPSVRAMIPPPADNQFAGFANNRFLPALSPDGRQLVVPVMDIHGKLSLWLRGLNDLGQGRILPGTDQGAFPFWSPDSRSIGYFVPGKLRRIDIEGDLVQDLADVTGFARGGTWGSSGIILYSPGQSSDLYQVPANGGTPRKVTERIASLKELSHRWPTFLPDGKHFLFFVADQEQPNVQGIYAGSLDTKEHHLVVKTIVGPAYERDGTIVYVRDGVIVTQPFDERKLVVSGEPIAMPDQIAISPKNNTALFSVSRSGNMVYYPAPPGPFALRWYDREGRRGDTLDTGFIESIALSPDGTRVAESIVENPNGNGNLWSFDVSRRTKTRLTSSLEDATNLVWQPDGQFVLFTSGFGGNQSHIYRTRSDVRGEIETVLRSEGIDESPRSICRDGRYLAYSRSSKDSPPSIWILPLTGDRKPFAFIQTRSTNSSPVFSPDCKWIAYVSGQNSGWADIYLANFPDATHRYQVSTTQSSEPRWRGDSKELFYYARAENSIVAVSVEEKGGELSLGAPRTLFPLSSPYASYLSFDVTPDGKRFLISTVNFPTATVPLTLVTNWEAELKKK